MQGQAAAQDPRRSWARHVWAIYLVVTLGLALGYGLAHLGGPAWLRSGLVFNLLAGASVAALIVGARANCGGRTPWYLFAAGMAMFLASDVISYNYVRLFGHAQPFPSVADQFHLAFYPFLVGGMLLLVRERRETRDRAPLIDALIVTTALAALLWVYLIAPYADHQSLSLLRRATSIAYPAMDILVLGVVARLAAGSHRGEPAFMLVLAGAVVLLVTDVMYGWQLLGGGFYTGGALDAGWGVFYALLGTAALHPSMRQLSRPGAEPDIALTPARLALLGVASVTVPLVIVIREVLHESVDVYVLTGASGAMFALVMLRLAGIVHANERATRREAAVRVAGEALVCAATREEIYETALRAARSVIDGPFAACLYLARDDGAPLEPVGCSDCDAQQLPAIRQELLESLGGGRLALGRVVSLQLAGREAYVSPLFVRERLQGALGVLGCQLLPRAAQESFAMLASEVALALQSIALTEESVHQRSEARLSSLIKNSSDVICVVSPDAKIQYVSPSAERTFGRHPDTLLERPLGELIDPDQSAHVNAFVSSVAAQQPGERLTAEFRVRGGEDGFRHVEALASNLQGDETIAGIVLNLRDISERKAFEAELEHQAFHDVLTGLPNRALFRDRVRHALAAQRRERLPVAVLFMDLDDFKNVNDGLGHAAGDKVLREVGRRLEDCMRPADTAARLGGDEFAILIRDAETDVQAIDIAQRVMDVFAMPIALENRDVTIATSIGIAFSDPTMTYERSADELLRNADTAMYMAKENGKSQYRIFEPAMHARALARLELKTDLQRALDAGEFTVRYQPIMDLRRGDMAGMEALIRWEHPTRGTVQPLEFVPLLEDTGLIVPVGRYILAEACSFAALLQSECPRDPSLSVAVNISAHQLQRPEFIEEVRSVLRESAITPSSLTLELTESVMMEDLELSLLRLHALRALGVKLAIDDFGTGYSSLNYVRQFPMDILKIDRSFLLDPNPETAELTEAIVSLAKILKLQAVAEGVETIGQLARLQGINCDFGQGFHFAKPLSRAQILEMATRQQDDSASAEVIPLGARVA